MPQTRITTTEDAQGLPDLLVAFLQLYDGVLFPPILFVFLCALVGSLLNALFNFFHLEKAYRDQFWVTKKNTDPVVVRSATTAHIVVTQGPQPSTPAAGNELRTVSTIVEPQTPQQMLPSYEGSAATQHLLAHNAAPVDYGGVSAATILATPVDIPKDNHFGDEVARGARSPSSPPPSSNSSFNSYDAEERDEQLALLPMRRAHTKPHQQTGNRYGGGTVRRTMSQPKERNSRWQGGRGGGNGYERDESLNASGVGSPLAATPTMPPPMHSVLSSELSSGVVADGSAAAGRSAASKRRYMGPVEVKESLEVDNQPKNSSFASGGNYAPIVPSHKFASSINSHVELQPVMVISVATPLTGHPPQNSQLLGSSPAAGDFMHSSMLGINSFASPATPQFPSFAQQPTVTTHSATMAGGASPSSMPQYIGNANEMEAVSAQAKQHAIQQSRTRERKEVIQWVIMSTSDTYFTISLCKTLLMIVYFGYHFDQQGGMDRFLVLSSAYYAGGALSPAILLMLRYVLPLKHIEGTIMSSGGILDRKGDHQAIHSPAQYTSSTTSKAADSTSPWSKIHVALGANDIADEWFTIDMLFTPNFDVEGLWNCFNQGATFVTVGCVVLPAFAIFALLAWFQYFWYFAIPIIILAFSRRLYYASLVDRPPAVDLVYYCMYRAAMLTSMVWMLQTGFIFGSIYLVGNTKAAAPIKEVLHSEGRSAYLSLPVAELSLRMTSLETYFDLMSQTYFGIVSTLTQIVF